MAARDLQGTGAAPAVGSTRPRLTSRGCCSAPGRPHLPRECGERQQEKWGWARVPLHPPPPASVRVFRHKPLRLHVRLRGARGAGAEADRDKHHRCQLRRPGLPHRRRARVRQRPRPRPGPVGLPCGQALGAALVPQAGAEGAGDGRGGVAAAAQQPLRGAGLGHRQGLGAVRLAEVRSRPLDSRTGPSCSPCQHTGRLEEARGSGVGSPR